MNIQTPDDPVTESIPVEPGQPINSPISEITLNIPCRCGNLVHVPLRFTGTIMLGPKPEEPRIVVPRIVGVPG